MLQRHLVNRQLFVDERKISYAIILDKHFQIIGEPTDGR